MFHQDDDLSCVLFGVCKGCEQKDKEDQEEVEYARSRSRTLSPVCSYGSAYGSVHGVLAQYGQMPDATNVAYKENFHKAFRWLFFKTKVFKRNREFRQLAMDFQIVLLKRRYVALANANSAYVKNKTIHAYIWNILTKILKLGKDEREKIAFQVVGDYMYYGRRDRHVEDEDYEGLPEPSHSWSTRSERMVAG